MNRIESDRLVLIPLEEINLIQAIHDYENMQISLGLVKNNNNLDEGMLYAMEVRLRKVKENINEYKWFTNWAVVIKNEMKIIGFVMIKGTPNDNGEVIVGYGIDEIYQRKGYATESVKCLSDWIFMNEKVQCIIADTDKENIASHKVLLNLGAEKYKETEDLIWWKMKR